MQYEVEQMLKRGWSPELIAGRIKTHRRDLPSISHEAIYRWIYDCRRDLIVGPGRAALQVAVERQFRYTRIAKIKDKSAQSSRTALEKMLFPIPAPMRRSITYDNGLENVQHSMLKKSLGVDSWFCDPYHSWEKGLAENTNGLIRRFIPKRTSIDDITDRQIQNIENWLNNRPRKVLNFKTPSEAFKNLGVALTG